MNKYSLTQDAKADLIAIRHFSGSQGSDPPAWGLTPSLYAALTLVLQTVYWYLYSRQEPPVQSADIIKAVTELAAHHEDIAALWLYGSQSKGTALPHSDFDFAVAFNNFKLSPTDKYLRPNELALEWSDMLKIPSDKLSIVDINQAPIYLCYNIIETGKLLYHQGDARVWHEQDRIYSQFEHQQIENRIYDRT